MPDGTMSTTDNIAATLQKNGTDYATIRNLHDGVNINKEVIFNHKPGNYLKSR